MRAEATDRLRIVVCRHFVREVVAALRAEGLQDVAVESFPTSCDHPRTDWEKMVGTLPAPQLPHSHTYILGGTCCARLDQPPGTLEQWHLDKRDQCFHFICPKGITDHLAHQGSHIVTPGWLASWRERMEERGFDQGTARDFFGEFAVKLVLLDTGVDEHSDARLREFADYLGIPMETVPVGLDHLQLQLSKLVKDWQLEQKRESDPPPAEMERQLADYAMVMDLIGDIGGATSEGEVVDRMLEISSILFVPSRLGYLPVVNGNAGPPSSRPAGLIDEAASSRLLGLQTQYGRTEAGDGFLLTIGGPDDKLGVLMVDGLAFPAYRERYLSLSVTLGTVCGLAIANARTFARIRAADEALAAERERLAVTLRSIGDGMIATDAEGKIVLINEVAERLSGWNQREAEGRPLEEVFHIVNEFTGEPCENPVEKAIKSGSTVGLANHTALIARDGTMRSIADSAAPIRDGRGSILGVVMVFRDITERERAEEQLEWESKVNAAVAALSSAVVSSSSIDGLSEQVLEQAKALTDSPFGFTAYLSTSHGIPGSHNPDH